MSWTVASTGKPAAVAAFVAQQFAAITCAEPEQTIKNSIAQAVDVALKAFPADVPVRVQAHGSQSTNSDRPGVATNQLSVEINPIWGFVE